MNSSDEGGARPSAAAITSFESLMANRLEVPPWVALVLQDQSLPSMNDQVDGE